MIETTWIDDDGANRLLAVMEDRCFELKNAIAVLDSLTTRYFDAYNAEESRRECAKQVSADYDTICATLALVRSSFLDFDADLCAALSGSDPRVEYRKHYLDRITVEG